METQGRDVALIGAESARTFCGRGLRLDEMFERLLLPLCEQASIELDACLLEETAKDFHAFHYSFRSIDIVLVEGIFLFKRQYAGLFDLRIWIECSFERSLERAVARSQEGLTPKATIDAYDTIYFPAQMIHFERDDPRISADIVINND